MSEHETLGAIMRRTRIERAMSEAIVGEVCGVHARTIMRWEDGVGLPKRGQLVAIANVLAWSKSTRVAAALAFTGLQ